MSKARKHKKKKQSCRKSKKKKKSALGFKGNTLKKFLFFFFKGNE